MSSLNPAEAKDDIEFTFNFNGQLKPPPLSAAELFDGGKIRPLKLLPTRSQYWGSSDSPPSPKRMLTKAFIFSPPLRKTKEAYSSTRKKDQSKCLSEPTKIQQISKETASLSSSSSSSPSSSWSRKWKLLFRSASEGHATSKDESSNSFLRKISHKEDVKNFSFRSKDSSNSGSRSGRRKTGWVSAHEWHYKKNKAKAAAAEEEDFLALQEKSHGLHGY